MKIVPREQYMAAMTFVTLPGQVGPLLGPALGDLLVEYASWHDLFDQHSGGDYRYRSIAHIDVNAELYHADAALYDLSGFLLLAVGMAVLTHGARRQ